LIPCRHGLFELGISSLHSIWRNCRARLLRIKRAPEAVGPVSRVGIYTEQLLVHVAPCGPAIVYTFAKRSTRWLALGCSDGGPVSSISGPAP
jgi:hypothetical protein